jgi:hypothetical protein
MSVACRRLPTREASLLELPEEPVPALLSLAEGHLKPENLPLAVLAYANRQHGGRPGRTAFWRRTLNCIASSIKNGYSWSRGRSAQA